MASFRPPGWPGQSPPSGQVATAPCGSARPRVFAGAEFEGGHRRFISSTRYRRRPAVAAATRRRPGCAPPAFGNLAGAGRFRHWLRLAGGGGNNAPARTGFDGAAMDFSMAAPASSAMATPAPTRATVEAMACPASPLPF